VRALVDYYGLYGLLLWTLLDSDGLVDFYYILLWTVWTIIMDCYILLLCTV
jgi:hypothetical protein